MKLIDKDSLMEIMNCNKPLADGYHMKDYVFEQILHDIDNEPIIEAIPIEYLCKELKQCKASTVVEVGAIIDKWVKENETN